MSKYTLKQIAVSAMIAIFSASLIYVVGTYLMGAADVSHAVATAVFIAISSATIFALLVPYILSKKKLDPAIGSGPFTTTVQDFLSILIYFITASLLL